jgi:Escherichia/Staphylococcus phage prohead protease
VGRGDVRRSSFAFRVLPNGDDWNVTDQGYPMRTLLQGQLIDVAPVNTPAYVDTTAGLRSFAAKFNAELDEVRSYAEADELRKFFVRTDGPPAPKRPTKRLFGPAAVAAALSRQRDPWS